MSTFGLVHGAWHGGWCWQRLAPELEARGHTALAVDLPAGDPDATWSDYGRAIADALAGVDEDVVLVGHSLAGMSIPIAATLRPVQRMVFMCAIVPAIEPEAPLPNDDPEPPTHPPGAFDALVHHPDESTTWPEPGPAIATLYHDCDPDDARWAFSQLRRQCNGMWRSAYPLERWPEAERVSIHCADDRAITPAWSRWVARNRLGVESIEMPGGHSSFLSRPAEVADLLTTRTADR